MAFPPPPPGMVYAYPAPPPGQGFPPYPTGVPMQSAQPRPKRKQVKMACTNCAGACKRCDEARPCERCVKYGIADTCVDGVRKERKKGIKRGPYKRKNRTSDTPSNGATEQPAPPAPYPMPPEGYYPYFYPHPPPSGYVPPAHDGQTHGEAVPNGSPQPIPHPGYYPMHPAMYPPFPGYASAGPMPYGVAPAAVSAPQQNGTHSSSTNGKANGDGNTEASGSGGKSKKRSRAKGDDEGGSKSKKNKPASSTTETQANGTTNGANGTNGTTDANHAKEQFGSGTHEAGPAVNGTDMRTLVSVQ
ncbi:hypothetical protein CERSUDRAFT_88317 [Gelatoporia subvermispora B]|uniref:Transcription activator of gluconeogenesis ERT1 n=1 Tax=Ceriporiopsis subvermispora (strain B) TaxID=914234 RepID=M2QJN0_CERS8|nr:hypothetical protein CERSUDRAFT_88317 [Gelatoporia subvermispora B]